MATSINSLQSPSLKDHVPEQTRIGIEIYLDPDMPEPKLSLSLVAGDPGSDSCLGLFYRVDLDALETWAKKINFLSGSFGYSVEARETTEDFRDFPKILYGNIWESRVLRFIVMVLEQLKALVTGFYKLSSHQMTVWCRHVDPWTPPQLRGHLLWLTEKGGFIEVE